MDSAPITGLVFLAIYIVVFLAATSITITLFTTINQYTETVSDHVRSDSISQVVSENENVYNTNLYNDTFNDMEYTLDGYEVYSLVNNYGMYVSNSEYKNGRKYEEKLELNYKIKVLNSPGSLVTSIDGIILTAQYKVKVLNSGYMELIKK